MTQFGGYSKKKKLALAILTIWNCTNKRQIMPSQPWTHIRVTNQNIFFKCKKLNRPIKVIPIYAMLLLKVKQTIIPKITPIVYIIMYTNMQCCLSTNKPSFQQKNKKIPIFKFAFQWQTNHLFKNHTWLNMQCCLSTANKPSFQKPTTPIKNTHMQSCLSMANKPSF